MIVETQKKRTSVSHDKAETGEALQFRTPKDAE